MSRVLSGGQTGADQGALQAARAVGIETWGYAPKGFQTEDGPNPLLLRDLYKLDECQGGYASRDRANVDALSSDDFVVAFRLSRPLTGAGTDKTLNYAVSGRYDLFARPLDATCRVLVGRRQCLIVWNLTHETFDANAKWLRKQLDTHWRRGSSSQLLVTGPCESTEPGIGTLVRDFLVHVLTMAQA